MAEKPQDARTVFVRNIGFEVDQATLEAVFTDVGPVRQCFLVSNKGQQRHRGIAFVQYAIPEDADRAVEDLNGKQLNGRKLKIEHALKRTPLQERKQKKRAQPDDEQLLQQQQADEHPAATEAAAQHPKKRQKTTTKQQPSAAAKQHTKEKHKWVRTVALGGLSPEHKSCALNLAAAAGGLIEVLDPAPADLAGKAHLTEDGCSGDMVFLVYSTVKDAMNAIKQLHRKVLPPAYLAAATAAADSNNGKLSKMGKKLDKKGAKPAAQQQWQQQAAAAAAAAVAAGGEGSAGCESVTLWARAVSGEAALVKKWRIILRNLAFQATEADVRKLLEASGTYIWDVTLPKGPDGRVRGFAFASFLSFPEAQKALQAINGQLVRKRPVAADWALGKGQYQQLKGQQQQQQQQQQQGGANAAELHDAAAANGVGAGSDSEGSGPSDSADEGSGLSDQGQDGFSGDAEDEEPNDEWLSVDESASEEDEKADGLYINGDDVNTSIDEEDEGPDAERDMLSSALNAVLLGAQQQQPEQEDNQQQQQQRQQQQQQRSQAPGGAQEAAVPCTVFVRGIALDITSQELQARFDRFGPVKACRPVVDRTTGKPKGTAFIEFKTPEAAAAAAAAGIRAREGKGPDVTVKGVKLNVDLALTQDDARRLGQEGLAAGSKGLGGKFDRRNLYLAKEGFIEEGSAQWQAMSENDRRKRKRAAEEKKTKLKSPNFVVSTTRLVVRNIPLAWDEAKLKRVFIQGVKERATKEKPHIKQVKILRDSERTDPAGNANGRSRGFGFVEFNEHSHALAALRQLNNNPTAFGSSERRPIVEFAVDDVKVLRMREDRITKLKQKQQQGGVADGARHQRQLEDGQQSVQQDNQQPEQQQRPKQQHGKQQVQQQPNGVEQQPQQLTKRQLKRRKEKEKRSAKMQKHQQAAAQSGQQHEKQLKGKSVAAGQQGKTKKLKGAVAATAVTAAAGRARFAAQAARQQRQATAEAVAHSRKRQADELLDTLAASDGRQQQRQRGGQQNTGQGPAVAAAGGPDVTKKRHKPGRAQEDRLEQMVADYKSKLFGPTTAVPWGGRAAKGAGSHISAQADSIKRWFE